MKRIKTQIVELEGAQVIGSPGATHLQFHVVFSKSLEKAEWNNSRLLKEFLPQEFARLKQQPAQDMLIYGSASIVQSFTKLGLVDEYQLLFHPVVLGSGKPLFIDMANPVRLRLSQTKNIKSGVVGLYSEPVAE